MKYPYPGEEPAGEIESEPEPWEQQPDEPLDRYRWFQIYLTLPPPRNLTSVAQTAGLSPGSRLVAKAGCQWSWKERAAACDDQGTAFYSLLTDWRSQLLNELAYVARFSGLNDTGRALADAATATMDRAELCKHLGTLIRRQRGLLSLITPMKEAGELDFDEKELYWTIVERAREIGAEWVEPVLQKIYREVEPDTANEPDSSGSQRPDAALNDPQTDIHQDPGPDVPAEIIPWEQQPEETAKHFYQFRIYLSLMFLQSTWQVARMAGIDGETTLAKIARKWTWQERAAAFQAHLADQPFARDELQHQILQDKAYESHLHGLLQSNRALEKADIGRLDCATTRKLLPLLAGRQRDLLQQVSRINEASNRKSRHERRDVRLAGQVEERALQMATEGWYESNEVLQKLYGNSETADDERD